MPVTGHRCARQERRVGQYGARVRVTLLLLASAVVSYAQRRVLTNAGLWLCCRAGDLRDSRLGSTGRSRQTVRSGQRSMNARVRCLRSLLWLYDTPRVPYTGTSPPAGRVPVLTRGCPANRLAERLRLVWPAASYEAHDDKQCQLSQHDVCARRWRWGRVVPRLKADDAAAGLAGRAEPGTDDCLLHTHAVGGTRDQAHAAVCNGCQAGASCACVFGRRNVHVLRDLQSWVALIGPLPCGFAPPLPLSLSLALSD